MVLCNLLHDEKYIFESGNFNFYFSSLLATGNLQITFFLKINSVKKNTDKEELETLVCKHEIVCLTMGKYIAKL
jgi:hypothetical protein